MNRYRKSLICSILMMCLFLVGCAIEEIKDVSKAENTTKGREVVDCSKNVVRLPKAKDIKRIVITSPPVVTMTNALLDDPSKIVGIHPLTLLNANTDLLKLKMPKVKELDDTYVKGFNIDIEKLLNLKPDIVFCYGEQQKKDLKNLNIPVVDFYKEGEKDSAVIIKEWEEIICKVFDISPKISIKKEIEKVEAFKGSMNKSQKQKKALLIFNNSGDKITVCGNHTYGEYWIEFAGMENVAKEIKGEKEVSMEQIYEWQPDVIYLFMGPGEKMYKKGIKKQDWTRVNAVKNGQIYDIPVGLFNWASPCVDTPLMMKWMLNGNKRDTDFVEEIKEYYKRCYDLELTDELAEKILKPQKGVILK